MSFEEVEISQGEELVVGRSRPAGNVGRKPRKGGQTGNQVVEVQGGWCDSAGGINKVSDDRGIVYEIIAKKGSASPTEEGVYGEGGQSTPYLN